MMRSGQLIVSIVLRVPVAIEVVPVLWVAPDPHFELISELLCRRLDGLIARRVGGDNDRVTRSNTEAPVIDSLDEARHERRSAQKGHQCGGPQKPGWPAEERHLDTIAA